MWKQHIYSFLLRRLLGPLLSTSKHGNIDLNVTEGRFVLGSADSSSGSIALNADYVSSIISAAAGIRVVSAVVDQLEIQLSLEEQQQENDGGDTNNTTRSSLAWRAFRLGMTTSTAEESSAASSSSSSSVVVLVAHVMVRGLSLQIASCPVPSASTSSAAAQPPAVAPTTTTEAKSMIASYIAGALSSLQVHVQLDHTRIRVVSDHDATCWTEVRIPQVVYAADRRTGRQQLDVTRMSVLTGRRDVDDDREDSTITVALMDGTSRLAVAVVVDAADAVSADDDDDDEHPAVPPLFRTEVDATIEKCNLSVCAQSLLCIKGVVQGFLDGRKPAAAVAAAAEPNDTSTPAAHSFVSPPPSWLLAHSNDNDDDERDVATMDALVQQYQEARMLVERKELRGGILVPATDESGLQLTTFDTFFDANEFSASTVLLQQQSVYAATGRGPDQERKPDWIHAKLHWQEGGIKVLLDKQQQQHSPEYVLLTVGGITVESTVSRLETLHSVRVEHCAVENSHWVVDDAAAVGDTSNNNKTIEIGSLLRFAPALPHHGEDDPFMCMDDGGGDDDSRVGEGPDVDTNCLALKIQTVHGKEEDVTAIDLQIQPVEIAYYMATSQKVMRLAETVGRLDISGADGDDDCIVIAEEVVEPRKQSCTLAVFCDRIEVSLPLPSDNVEWGKLYHRCGYACEDGGMRKPCLGITVDRCAVEMQQNTEVGTEATFRCNNMVGFASTPKAHNAFDTRTHRFDLFGLCGRDEVEPHIPFCLEVKTGFSSEQNVAVEVFPKVVPISSFKTRQDDEDEGKVSEMLDISTESSMLANAAKCEVVVTVQVPEILIDISSTELQILAGMAGALRPERNSDEDPARTTVGDPLSTSVLVSLACDFVSLTLRDDVFGEDSFALVCALDRPKSNFCIQGASLSHIRFLVHELSLYEGKEHVFSRSWLTLLVLQHNRALSNRVNDPIAPL